MWSTFIAFSSVILFYNLIMIIFDILLEMSILTNVKGIHIDLRSPLQSISISDFQEGIFPRGIPRNHVWGNVLSIYHDIPFYFGLVKFWLLHCVDYRTRTENFAFKYAQRFCSFPVQNIYILLSEYASIRL